MDPTEGLVTIASKISDFYFTAFHYKIVCGPLIEFCHQDSCSFEFSCINYHKIFLTLFSIAKILSGCSSYTSGIICYNKNGKYGWLCFDKNGKKVIQILIIRHKKLCYQYEMCDIAFNEFVQIIGQLILPSLCIREDLFPLFKHVLYLDLEILLSFQKTEVFQLFMDTKFPMKLKESQKYCATVVMDHNLHSLIAANKIISLFNQNLALTKRYIEEMENC